VQHTPFASLSERLQVKVFLSWPQGSDASRYWINYAITKMKHEKSQILDQSVNFEEEGYVDHLEPEQNSRCGSNAHEQHGT
jgi:hypothetical protein